jgi:hypothetical protein
MDIHRHGEEARVELFLRSLKHYTMEAYEGVEV